MAKAKPVTQNDLIAVGGHIAAFLVLILARSKFDGEPFTHPMLTRRGRIKTRHAQSGLAKLAALGMVERLPAPSADAEPVYRLTEKGGAKAAAKPKNEDLIKSNLSNALAVKLGGFATSTRACEAGGTESS